MSVATRSHFRNVNYKDYTKRSNLSQEVKEILAPRPQDTRRKSVHALIEENLRNAGAAGMDLDALVKVVFSDRKPVVNPRNSIQTAISALRRKGEPIYNTGSIYRLGAPVILQLAPVKRRPGSDEAPLSDRELEVLSILREWKDEWLSAMDIVEDMKLTRNGSEVTVMRVSQTLKNIAAKGIKIEYKGANAGSDAFVYKISRNIEPRASDVIDDNVAARPKSAYISVRQILEKEGIRHVKRGSLGRNLSRMLRETAQAERNSGRVYRFFKDEASREWLFDPALARMVIQGPIAPMIAAYLAQSKTPRQR